MENLIQIVTTLLIKIENGLTPTKRIAHKTIKIPYIRRDMTLEEIRAHIAMIAPALAGRIVSVDLVTETVTTVWTPEMREEKLEEEMEGVAEAKQAKQTSQASAMPSSSSAQGNSMHTAPAVMAEAEQAETDATPAMPYTESGKEGKTMSTMHTQKTPYNPNVIYSHDGRNKIDMTAFLAMNPDMRLVREQPKTVAHAGYVPPLSYADIPGYADHAPGF